MPAVISLRDVVEALDLQSDELSSYLDPESGEIITFNAEEASIARSADWANAPNCVASSMVRVLFDCSDAPSNDWELKNSGIGIGMWLWNASPAGGSRRTSSDTGDSR